MDRAARVGDASVTNAVDHANASRTHDADGAHTGRRGGQLLSDARSKDRGGAGRRDTPRIRIRIRVGAVVDVLVAHSPASDARHLGPGPFGVPSPSPRKRLPPPRGCSRDPRALHQPQWASPGRARARPARPGGRRCDVRGGGDDDDNSGDESGGGVESNARDGSTSRSATRARPPARPWSQLQPARPRPGREGAGARGSRGGGGSTRSVLDFDFGFDFLVFICFTSLWFEPRGRGCT